jgi:hypothetical protein
MSPEMQMLDAFIESTFAYLLFSAILLSLYVLLVVLALTAWILIAAAWRWLWRHSWASVVVLLQRRALR